MPATPDCLVSFYQLANAGGPVQVALVLAEVVWLLFAIDQLGSEVDLQASFPQTAAVEAASAAAARAVGHRVEVQGLRVVGTARGRAGAAADQVWLLLLLERTA